MGYIQDLIIENPQRLIDPEYLRSVFAYDPETGEIRWSAQPTKLARIQIGAIAGRIDGKGYRRIGLSRMYFGAHRIAWAIYYGEWPKLGIDHINLDRSDNRICNLRLADQSDNLANRRAPSNNTSGFKGVTFQKRTGRWQATIQVRGQRKYLGRFNTPEQAYAAYCAAAENGYGSFARVA